MVHWCFMALNCVASAYCYSLRKKQPHFYFCRNVLLFNINQWHYHNSGSYFKRRLLLKTMMEMFLSRKEQFSRNKRDINVRPLDGDRVVSVFLYSKAGVHVRSTPRTLGAVLGGQPSVLLGRKRLRKVESRCPPSRTEIPAGIPCSKVTLTLKL